MSLIKKIEVEKIFKAKDVVGYTTNAVGSLTVTNKEQINITLMAFDAGQELSTHSAPGDAYITILDGYGHVFIDGVRFDLKVGESIIMPEGKPHSVHADEKMKMQLVLVK